MPKCDACPVDGPCEGEVASRICHLAKTRPDYRATLVANATRIPIAASSGRALADPLGEWSYVTREQLASDTKRLIAHLPPDVDLVVAIARSGWLVGADIATARHLPLRSVSRHSGLVDPGHGLRMEGRPAPPPRHVVVVDDTVASGREMVSCAEIVRRSYPTATITRSVIYAHPASMRAVDLCVREYPGLHYLEWNWQNAGHGAKCAYDFDGILCHDDDPECRPLFLPVRTPIPLIVTGRHESVRGLTQDWLDRWGVRCDRLAMRDFGAVEDYSGSAAFKAREYARRPDIKLFAESDPNQARQIADISGKAVLCPRLGSVIPPRILSLLAAIEPDPEERRERAMACDHRGEPVRKGCVRFHCKFKRQVVTISDCVTCPMTLED